MDNFDLVLAARMCLGELAVCNAKVQRVSTDSRQVQTHDLYVALKGERFDGHDFVAQAFASGASGALVNKDFVSDDSRLIRVADTRKALGLLAGAWRDLFKGKVIAITGSNGKTTVKEMLAAILRRYSGEATVLATEGNFNNDIGVPLTLLRLEASHQYAVIEMGMNHPGEIKYLSQMAKPDVALINNVSLAHVGGGFANLAEIAQAKAEIFDGLRHNGIALLNANDESYELLSKLARAYPTMSFGISPNQSQDEVFTTNAEIEMHQSSSQFVLHDESRQIAAINLPCPGLHNVRNALAASAAALKLNIPFSCIQAGLENFPGVASRLQRKTASCGALIIDDTYNANPASMFAALDVLKRYLSPRIFVMGDIGELGEAKEAELHEEVISYAYQIGIEHIFTLGELSQQAAKKCNEFLPRLQRAFADCVQSFSTIEELLLALESLLNKDSTLLIKGSRFMLMERVVKHFIAPQSAERGA